MIKKRNIIILSIIYVVFYLSFIYKINILYPYYLIKDFFLLPSRALTKDEDISLSKDLSDSIINSLKNEIKELKILVNIKTVLSDFDYVNATVIERNREYWFNTLTLDKGIKSGIKEDMAVISDKGLIGRINSVTDYTSTVKLITTNDVMNKISVVIKNNDKDIYGILSGYDEKKNLLKVILNDNYNILDNTKVETTGMGGVFPSGILIGYTKEIIKDYDDVKVIALIKPSSEMEGLRYVRILQRK